MATLVNYKLKSFIKLTPRLHLYALLSHQTLSVIAKGTHREYSSKPLKHSIVERILNDTCRHILVP